MDDIRTRRLLKVAAALGQNVDDLWSVYNELFNEVDLDDPDVFEVMLDLLTEMAVNLCEMLNRVEGQLYILTGIHEPLPLTQVEDFEESVLRDIGSLDTVDLEQYRVPVYEDEYPDE